MSFAEVGAADTPTPMPTPGMLASNFTFVNGLRSALSKTETNVATVEKSLRLVIDQGCWRHWLDPNGKEVQHNAADFRQFIESPWPVGCGVSISLVRKTLKDTDVLVPFEDLIRGEPGNLSGKRDASGRFYPNRDNVTEWIEPTTIPLSPDTPRPRKRDYSREAPTGNDTGYALRRLGKDRPDLHEKVIAGDVTPNAAMVQAGFRKPTITLPLEVESAVRLIVKHFKGDLLDALIRGLANWRGFKVIETTTETANDTPPEPQS
jgi:hypothetical protein